MREFVLPFKPEELLAQPSDGRLWAGDLPAVDEWNAGEAGSALDALIGRLLPSHGYNLAEDESFSLIFAVLQAWARLDVGIHARVVDLLTDAARRVSAEVGRVKKASAKSKDPTQQQVVAREARTVSKVFVFFLRWCAERVLRQSVAEAQAAPARGRGRGKGAKRGAAADAQEQELSAEELRDLQKALERQRIAVLGELANLLGKGALPWLWTGDPSAWQQVAQAVSDAGFLVLDSAEALKQREVRQAALRCITEPLLQEGHQHSNLLVATVSKLLHGLRGGESGAPFAADALVLAHSTPLPRLILVELTQHCNPSELTSQGAFQRALGSFLSAVAERLPHVVLANISVLLPLLDVDCYPLRNAIVESIGQLLAAEGRKLPAGARCNNAGGSRSSAADGGPDSAGAGGEDAAEAASAEAVGEDAPGGAAGARAPPEAAATFTIAAATKRDLLETLVARSLDKSVWVRYRVLQTLTSLASNTRVAALPREQWARVLEIATRRMQDSASTTRKASMQLVRTLIEFHPYGPALQGSGDERAKAEQLLREVAVRLQKLQAEEVAEAEEAAEAAQAAMAAGSTAAGAAEAAGPAEEEEERAEAAEAGEGGDEEQGGKRCRLKKKTVTEQTITGEVDRCLAEADEGGDRAEERKHKREALRRMQDCYSQRLHFVELLDAAEARLRGLLVSRTVTDVTEAVGVVVELRLRGVPAAARAFDQVLGLVWSRQASIKDAAVDAFHRMHLEGRDPIAAMQALIEMYQEGCAGGTWTYTHLASVQELIQQAAEKDLIDVKQAIPALVDALQGPRCPMALRALTAFGAANGAQLASMLPQICKALGPGSAAGGSAATQLERARLLCQLLQRLHGCARAPLAEEAWDQIWALSQHATHVVVSAFAHAQVPPQWFGAAQAAMDLSFDISMAATGRSDAAQCCPDKLWEQILSRMLCSILRPRDTAPLVANAAPIMDAPRVEGAEGESSAASAGRDVEDAVVPAEPAEAHKVCLPQIGCIVFLAGHLALRMLVFLEGLQSALKRKRLADEDARMTEQREKGKKKTGKKGKGGKEEEEGGGAEASSLGMAGQEEREADAFAELAESGLLYGPRSFLDRVKPLVFSCLLDPELRKDTVLRRAGAISLCKFMTVSKRFCEENLQILFSVLFPKGKDAAAAQTLSLATDAQEFAQDAATAANASKSGTLFEDLTLRQSLLVAVGDLLFRHPNVVEPWTGRLYGTLSAPAAGGAEGAAAAELRLTALLVLTHLVLNDMMKPRAVLLVRALWLTACTHEATARVARILFQELSKRSTNIVYNLLPEIIARLPEHQGAAGHVEGGAEGRVQYVMQFVEKEKHVEGLIEKLTLRLEQTANVAGSANGARPSEETLESTADALDDVAPPAHAQETVSCLANALGAMNYTDRCILRLHDAVVTRKALHTAISYHPVVRECLLTVVEKARKPRPGKERAGAEAPAADAEAGGAAAGGAEAGGGAAKGGTSAAAVAAIDAIEQTVTALAHGKEDAPDQPTPIADGEAGASTAVTPAVSSTQPARAGPGRGGRGTGAASKRKAEAQADPDNPGFEEEDEQRGGKRGRTGRGGRGRGGGRAGAGGRAGGRGVAAEGKENRPDAVAQGENAQAGGRSGKAPRGGGKAPGAAGAGAGKRRRAARAGDDDDYEE